MDANTVKETLVELIKEHSHCDGWINLAKLGLELNKNGIKYKELGHYKLTDFITSYSDLVEIRKDETHKLPVYLVKLRSKPSKSEKNRIINSSPRNALTNWAYLHDLPSTFEKLNKMALDERWFYKEKNPNFPYPILKSYLFHTYYKLSKETGKILKSGKYSVFNTGLVDNRYAPIYALFKKNTTYTQPWKRAHYFSDVSDMLYDTRAGAPDVDMRHILLDNAGRLPLSFLSENPPKDFSLKNPEIFTIEERNRYNKDLAKAIENDTKTYRHLTNRLKDAINLAIKRIEWNFKTAIPMYYPVMNKMSLLLPLSLVDDEVVNIALVVEKTKSGNYLGHTILPLEWAYNNARLVARPDSDWLVADQIEISSEEE